MKLIVSIIVNENNIGKIKLIEDTWIKLYNIYFDYYFFIDENFNIEEIVNIEKKNKYIKINNINHIKICSWFKNIEFEWLMICYIDTFINIKNLINYLKQIKDNLPLYIGGHGDWRQIGDIKFYFHSFTPGIILNKKSCNMLSDENLFNNYNNYCIQYNSELINNSGTALGFLCESFNIKIINCDNIWYCNCYGSPCHHNIPKFDKIISCWHMYDSEMNYYISYLNSKMKIIIAPSGGLGNLIFQYLYGMSLVKKYNCELFFYKNYKYWRGDMNNFKLFSNCNFIEEHNINLVNYIKIFEESNYIHKELELDNNNNYIIHGYFQSYKYSLQYIDEFKKLLFNNITDKYNDIKNNFFKLKENKKTCLIHVRRGDYINYPRIHPLCTNDYYSQAIEIMNYDTKFIICCDDIDFVNQWDLVKKLDYKIIEDFDPIDIFLLMTLCDNFIIANSTLSLCAYLCRENNNALLIGPKEWFGPDGPKYNINDILPDNCILL